MTDTNQSIHRAELNLQRHLEWISRYDTRIIFVAGIAIAMLGVLANASGLTKEWNCTTYMAFGISFILLIVSLVYVYKAQTPRVVSPNQSLLFFGTISKMGFNDFSDHMKETSDDAYLMDLLHQIHINSIILCDKFRYLKYSILFIGLSVVPWGVAIYLSKLYIK